MKIYYYIPFVKEDGRKFREEEALGESFVSFSRIDFEDEIFAEDIAEVDRIVQAAAERGTAIPISRKMYLRMMEEWLDTCYCCGCDPCRMTPDGTFQVSSHNWHNLGLLKERFGVSPKEFKSDGETFYIVTIHF